MCLAWLHHHHRQRLCLPPLGCSAADDCLSCRSPVQALGHEWGSLPDPTVTTIQCQRQVVRMHAQLGWQLYLQRAQTIVGLAMQVPVSVHARWPAGPSR